jgi:GTP-binding protein YchF
MQLGILGLPKAGKTTLFNTMTASHEATGKFGASDATHIGVAKVPDPRLAALRDLFEPKRYVPATVEYVDIPGLSKGEGAESLDLAKLKTVDALLHVVRAFADPEIPHPDGAIDPLRDVHTIDLELILSDHTLVEKRLERLAKAGKRGRTPDEEREQELLSTIVLPALESEKPLRAVELAPDDERRIRGFQLLTAKPMLVVLNVDEAKVAAPADPALVAALGATPVVVVSAPIEEEISRLPEEEQKEFLADLGLAEPSLHRVLRASFDLLGRIAFFTVGEDEVRAWTIRRGTRAKEAAGTIHSDIERGFIRAEVVEWKELLEQKSLHACRDKGTLRLEGKEYEVLDGDVVHFRFNV